MSCTHKYIKTKPRCYALRQIYLCISLPKVKYPQPNRDTSIATKDLAIIHFALVKM